MFTYNFNGETIQVSPPVLEEVKAEASKLKQEFNESVIKPSSTAISHFGDIKEIENQAENKGKPLKTVIDE